MSQVMHVNDRRRLNQKVIVNGGDFETRCTQAFHDRREFVLQENQVTHNCRVVVIPTERGPRAECESRLNLDPGN